VGGVNLATGLVVGLSLATLFENFWWLIWSGVAGLFFGGAVITALAGTSNIWHGVILALFYFGSVVIIYPIGQAAERWMPPQPNLPHHASTYILLWPVALLLAGTLRLFVGFIRSLNRRSKLPRFVPVMAALSVIILGTFRPIPLEPSQPEWRQSSPLINGSMLNEFSVAPLVADGQGGVWFVYKKVTGRGGVGHFRPKAIRQNKWQIYPAQSDDDEPKFDFALSLLSDGRQVIWVSSLKGSLSHYDHQTATWQAVTNFNSDVLAMTTKEGNLWLATFGDGVLCYDPATEHWQAYTQANTNGGLQDDEITVIVSDNDGGLWAGTYGGGLSRYHPTENTWQAFTVDSTGGGLGSDDVRTVVIDETGDVWVGTFGGGISRYHPLRNSWDLYTTQTTSAGLVSDYVLTLLPGRNGQMWAGLSNLHGQGGVAYFDGNRWQSHTIASTNGGLRSDDVRVLALDDEDGLWIGTRDGGLSHLAADRQTWTSFTVKSTHGGLADDTVLALLPDGVGQVWISTGSGLSYLRWHGP
jgi:streptogramin lyase